MSVFQVQFSKATNLASGYVTDPAFQTAYTTTSTTVTSGSATTTVISGVGGSNQKSMDVTGPNLTRRRLYDGQVFTSTNYWKRYASTSQGGNMAKLSDGTDPSFIYVVSDDGSPYSDKDKAVNKAAYVWTCQLTNLMQVLGAANSLNVVTQYGGPATYCQIMISGPNGGSDPTWTSNDPTQSVKCRINTTAGSVADVDIYPGSIGGGQIFDNYDLPISYLSFYLPAGSSNTVNCQVEVLLTVELISKD